MDHETALTLRVGVTGHRPNKLGPDELPRLAGEVERLLAALRAAADGLAGEAPGGRRRRARLEIVTPLAEGADRIVARAALDIGAGLVVLLPFPRADYERDFAASASRDEFRALLGRAAEIVELDGHHGTAAERKRAYEAVGALVVELSDVLIAIWDGRKADGSGGTAEIVALAREAGRPVLWLPTTGPRGQAEARPRRLLLGGESLPADAATAVAAVAKRLLTRQP